MTPQPFYLQTETLDPLIVKLGNHSNFPTAGGYVTFEGRVRNHHQGKDVVSLSYTAYPELALNEGNAIVAEALAKFSLVHALAAHRHGQLAIGDTAVWVAAWAHHRHEAFEAARYLIDQIKVRIPIWKEEFYADGSYAWVHCQH